MSIYRLSIYRLLIYRRRFIGHPYLWDIWPECWIVTFKTIENLNSVDNQWLSTIVTWQLSLAMGSIHNSHNSCKLYLSDHAWRVMRKDNCDALPLSHIWWRVSEWRLIEGWIALSTQPLSIIIIMSTQTQTVNHHTVSFTHLYKCHPFFISFLK